MQIHEIFILKFFLPSMIFSQKELQNNGYIYKYYYINVGMKLVL